jgi:hypothetical protein
MFSTLKYIAAALFGILLSCFAFVPALSSGATFGYTIGGILLIAHVVSFSFAAKRLSSGNKDQVALILISPIFFVWLIGTIGVLVYLAVTGELHRL